MSVKAVVHCLEYSGLALVTNNFPVRSDHIELLPLMSSHFGVLLGHVSLHYTPGLIFETKVALVVRMLGAL